MTRTTDELLVALTGGADGATARLEHTFRTDADDLWRAVSEPERVSRWMAPTTLDGPPAVGARYTIDFGDDQRTTGEVVRCEAPRLLEVTWELPGEPDSVVRLEVRPGDDGAVLVLEHLRLPARQATGHAAGWQAHLATLAAQVEDGPAPDWDELFGRLWPAYRAAYPDLP